VDVGPLWATLIDWMQGEDRHRLSWCVRHDRPTALDAELVDELVQTCKETCAVEFSTTDGYVTSIRRLSGALEGASLAITRGRTSSVSSREDFSALISIQRYVRDHGASTAEIRVVAWCRHQTTELACVRADTQQTWSRWGVASCALGTMGVGVAGLGVFGLFATWGQVLLLLPALMAWRMCMAVRMATSLRQQATHRLHEDPSAIRERQRLRSEDYDRWHRVAEVLLAQRDAMGERSTMRPFRTQGAQPGRMVLRPAKALPALPAVLPVPS
jgi:hypothetical protein